MLACRAIPLLLLCAACVSGGVIYTFENPHYTGSNGGTALGGQDGWGVGGAGANPVTGWVVTYAGNGLPVAPGGGGQFVGMIGPHAGNVHSASFAGSTEWAVTFDVLVHSFGTGNEFPIGDLFLYNTASGWRARAIESWDPVQNGAPNTWSALFDVGDAAGNSMMGSDTGLPGFHGLRPDYWYQQQIVFDTATDRILSVSLSDPGNPSANATYNPAGWYFRGGAAGTFDVNGIGLYGGGATLQNGIAFDNLSLDQVPEPAAWTLWLAGAATLCCLRGRRGRQR